MIEIALYIRSYLGVLIAAILHTRLKIVHIGRLLNTMRNGHLLINFILALQIAFVYYIAILSMSSLGSNIKISACTMRNPLMTIGCHGLGNIIINFGQDCVLQTMEFILIQQASSMSLLPLFHITALSAIVIQKWKVQEAPNCLSVSNIQVRTSNVRQRLTSWVLYSFTLPSGSLPRSHVISSVYSSMLQWF